MPIEKPRIVFMGTPEFAVASLDALVRAGYPVVGVITAPDKPAGRGMKLNQSAVKKYVLERMAGSAGILPMPKILQPEKLKNPQFLDELRALKADLQIVVAFRMLPESVWNMPPMGTVNLHGSLLPQYRGAAPINWAVINGETRTGVTTFKLQHAIDTGNILLQESFPIGDKETAGDVHDRMKEIGASLLLRTVEGLAAGVLKEVPQEKEGPLTAGPLSPGQHRTVPDPAIEAVSRVLKAAPKLFKEMGKIDWNQPVSTVYNLIRGLSPSPGAFTWLDGKLLKIIRCEKETGNPAIPPGNYSSDRKTYLKFACPDGAIKLEEIQLEGKKRMGIADFLRGYTLQ